MQLKSMRNYNLKMPINNPRGMAMNKAIPHIDAIISELISLFIM